MDELAGYLPAGEKELKWKCLGTELYREVSASPLRADASAHTVVIPQ